MARTREGNSRVSIVIVCHNELRHINGCVSSVLRQDYEDKEVIVVDNASTDGSFEYVKGKYPSVIVVGNSRNLGYAGGLNTGLNHATGQYIAPLNMDTEVAPGWLTEMVEAMRGEGGEGDEVGAVTPKIMVYHERSKVNAMGLNIHVSGLGFCRGVGIQDGYKKVSCAEAVPGLSGCSYLIHRNTLEAMGGFPAWTFMGNDDVIVSWLLRLMGYEIYCTHKAVVYHKYELRMTAEKLYYLEKGRDVLLLAALKPGTLAIMFPVLIAIEGMVFAYSILKGWPYVKSKVAAWFFLWRERNKISKIRKQYQALRRVSDWTLLKHLCWRLNWKQLRGVV